MYDVGYICILHTIKIDFLDFPHPTFSKNFFRSMLHFRLNLICFFLSGAEYTQYFSKTLRKTKNIIWQESKFLLYLYQLRRIYLIDWLQSNQDCVNSSLPLILNFWWRHNGYRLAIHRVVHKMTFLLFYIHFFIRTMGWATRPDIDLHFYKQYLQLNECIGIFILTVRIIIFDNSHFSWISQCEIGPHEFVRQSNNTRLWENIAVVSRDAHNCCGFS